MSTFDVQTVPLRKAFATENPYDLDVSGKTGSGSGDSDNGSRFLVAS